MRVDVETSSPLTAGQTVCDVWGHSGLPPNVDVAKCARLTRTRRAMPWVHPPVMCAFCPLADCVSRALWQLTRHLRSEPGHRLANY